MINDTPLSRYEYGYYRSGWGSNPSSGQMYYGPPHSFWYTALAVGFVGAAIAGMAVSIYFGVI